LGYFILERNYYTKTGELDLVCRETISDFGKPVSYLVFVEVKYRSSLRYGYASEAVNQRKQKRIYKSAQMYMKHHGYAFDQPIRFDILAIDGNEIKLIKNAFGGM